MEAVGHADGDLDPVAERLEPGVGAARFDGAWDVGAASPDFFFGKLDDLGDAAMRGPEHLRIISSVLADHPRSCGANLSGDGSDTIGDGSSPLVRGQQSVEQCRRRAGRIIPARAGPTPRRW